MSKFIVVATDDSSFLLKEAHNFLNLNNLKAVKRYEVFESNSDEDLQAILSLFDSGIIYEDLSNFDQSNTFRYRQVLGQYNEIEEMTNRLINNLRGHNLQLHHSTIIELVGLTEEEVQTFKAYYINQTEAEIVPFEPLNFDMGISPASDLQTVEGFIELNELGLKEFIKDYSMDLADIQVVQTYFKTENIDPTVFQLKVIDTYWSDHCRHTTFLTELSEITVSDGKYQEAIEATIAEYNEVRQAVYANRPKAKAVTLMDLATINAKYAKQLGLLDNLDESDEVNACCIRVKVDVDGEEEDYLLYFKNETHNHPTEIEPFGGAATCIGGGIRDPLSGRSYVHQAMRITGAKNPTVEYESTRDGKLAQRVITQRAARGFSDYSNQIGQTSGYVKEYYHDGFEAKRMELGALVGAAPVDNVVRIKPEPTDKIILLGGRTGRDGLGAAVGSSMLQTEQSIDLQGAEVQKGNPTIERKIIRLFRKPEVTRLIKKANDFGAGGVSVAIGELADGLIIDLDKVPTKYHGMDPSEIALSESQERMAVVVADSDVETFIALSIEEDLEATVVAEVTDSDYMVMNYDDKEVLRLKRSFLESNGGAKSAVAHITYSDVEDFFLDSRDVITQLQSIENSSQKALAQNFDFTIGKNTVLAPLGGKNQLTPQEGMVAKMPVLGKNTSTVSVMTSSFKPDLASLSPFHGAYYAVLNSIAKAVALGVPYQDIRLTLQEFFERMVDAKSWGKPSSALLGAFKLMKQLGLAAIGGKDSMSGTFQDINVPPSLISFAVATTNVDKVNSRELKSTDSKVILLEAELNAEDLIDTEAIKQLFGKVTHLINDGDVRSISTIDDKTIEMNLIEMALGNEVGFEMETEYLHKKPALGFLIELANDVEVEGEIIVARTNGSQSAIFNKAYSLADLKLLYTEPLADVFSDIEFVNKVETIKDPLAIPNISSDAKVLIPVMTGVHGEYDLYESFKRYTDHVDFFIIKEELGYQASIKEFANKLADYDILAFPDGSILSNQLQYGQAIELLINDIQKELEAFIEDKYILAIGASFAGFVRSGLMEFGRVQTGTSIQFKINPLEKFVSTIVSANVIKDSVYSSEGSYTTALSGYHLTVNLDEEKFSKQILSKYTAFFEDEIGIDAMLDPSGHILGVNSNFERFNIDGFNNIKTNEAPFIASLLKKVSE